MQFDRNVLPRALGLLRSAAGPTQAKRGCRACRVEQDATERGVLHYREEWDSEEAFRRHVRSDEFWPVLVAMDLCTEEPQVTIGDLRAHGGLQSLLALRGSSARDDTAIEEPGVPATTKGGQP